MFGSAYGRTLSIYLDEELTELADIQDLDGNPIQDSRIAIGKDSLIPYFLGPDGAQELYASPLGSLDATKLVPTNFAVEGGGGVASVNNKSGSSIILDAQDVGAIKEDVLNDPRRFGAAGDDTADDVEELQAAINAACANGAPLWITKTYRTNGTLTWDSSQGRLHIIMQGEGRINYVGSDVAFRFTMPLLAAGQPSVKIEGGRVTGTAEARAAFENIDARSLDIRNCEVEGFTNGAFLIQKNRHAWCERLRMFNNSSRNNRHFVKYETEKRTITNKSLTSNVATITFSGDAGNWQTGSSVEIIGVDETFNGSYTLTGATSTTISYARTASNVTSTAASGTIRARTSFKAQQILCSQLQGGSAGYGLIDVDDGCNVYDSYLYGFFGNIATDSSIFRAQGNSSFGPGTRFGGSGIEAMGEGTCYIFNFEPGWSGLLLDLTDYPRLGAQIGLHQNSVSGQQFRTKIIPGGIDTSGQHATVTGGLLMLQKAGAIANTDFQTNPTIGSIVGQDTSANALMARTANGYQWLPSWSSKRTVPGTAAPSTGAWTVGERVINTAPTAGSPEGWICLTNGSPGTWAAYGFVSTVSSSLLGSGTADETTYLAGDRTWKEMPTPEGGGGALVDGEGTTVTEAGGIVQIDITRGTEANQTRHGNDAAYSDARTPTAHASSHGSGQSDALTLAISQITGLQSALDAKESAFNVAIGFGLAKLAEINTQTGTSYTLVLADASKTVEMDNGGAMTVTVPTNASVAYPVGTLIEIVRLGAGTVTINHAGVTVNSPGGVKTIAEQYGSVFLRKRGEDEWVLSGGLG